MRRHRELTAAAAAIATIAAIAAIAAATASAHAVTAPHGAAHKPAPPVPMRQRAATDGEIAAFQEYYQRRYPAATPQPLQPLLPPSPPVFDIRRRSDKGPWSIIVRVDSRPRHAAPGLCHLMRQSFSYHAAAQKDQRWSDAGRLEEYIWLSGGAVPCAASSHPVLLAQALPPADLVSLLEQQATLLSRARLLFAGNTECARQRALNFTLSAIVAGTPSPGAPIMYGLVFQSDRDTTANIGVRKSRSELTAWNVSCPA